MDLEQYKLTRESEDRTYVSRNPQELQAGMRKPGKDVVQQISRSLRFEIIFAILFLLFDCFMIVFFNDIFFLRWLAIFLLAFAVVFIFFVGRLLHFIGRNHQPAIPVSQQLRNYIRIISQFTRLYYQVTLVMIPLLLVMGFCAIYLEQGQSVNFSLLISPPIVYFCAGGALSWIAAMYIVTGWYIKKLYGNHLRQLKIQLKELLKDK